MCGLLVFPGAFYLAGIFDNFDSTKLRLLRGSTRAKSQTQPQFRQVRDANAEVAAAKATKDSILGPLVGLQ